jgi:hypothetical protein
VVGLVVGWRVGREGVWEFWDGKEGVWGFWDGMGWVWKGGGEGWDRMGVVREVIGGLIGMGGFMCNAKVVSRAVSMEDILAELLVVTFARIFQDSVPNSGITQI